MEKKKSKNNVFDYIKFLFPAGLLGTLALYYFNNYLITPKIQYTYGREKDTFSVQSDFRGISMCAYPQMLICYDDYVILVTHLDKYYDQEVVHFEDKVGCAEKINQAYSDKLMQYIRESVLARLKESHSEDAMKEINEKFEIYISLIGGVQYENQLGNRVKKYCIIENNGLVIDYKYNAEEIANRLFENEIVLSDNVNAIEENAEISQMIEVVTKEVAQLYEGDYSSNLSELEQ